MICWIWVGSARTVPDSFSNNEDAGEVEGSDCPEELEGLFDGIAQLQRFAFLCGHAEKARICLDKVPRPRIPDFKTRCRLRSSWLPASASSKGHFRKKPMMAARNIV